MFVGCAFKDGDGIGGTEVDLGKAETAKKCIEMVFNADLTQGEPNGVTFGVLGDSREKECFAEFNMGESDGNSKWQSCILARKIIYILVVIFSTYTMIYKF